jgi:hypothetical protein
MLHLLVTTIFPPPPLFVELLFYVNLWIFVEEVKKKGKDYEEKGV